MAKTAKLEYQGLPTQPTTTVEVKEYVFYVETAGEAYGAFHT